MRSGLPKAQGKVRFKKKPGNAKITVSGFRISLAANPFRLLGAAARLRCLRE